MTGRWKFRMEVNVKKRKGSLLQRMLAVLLSAVLTAGMVSNAVPASVLAQEGSGVASVSGNDAKPADIIYGSAEKGWILYADGKLIITSDDGMFDWVDQSPDEARESVTSVEIKSGVTSIEKAAFQNCSAMKEIIIPDGVTSIGMYAFDSCSGLTSITIPKSVTSIDRWAFHFCSSLTSITIPEGVTSISSYMFSRCSSLTSIIIPEGVTKIEGWVFYGCSGLTSVTIPESMTSIGVQAFGACSGLTSITIPESVTSIGSDAFYNCSKLTEVNMKGETPPSLGSSVFRKCGFVTGSTQGIHVPSGKEQDYVAAWRDWVVYITDDPHTHSWSPDWTSNQTHHWHECTVSDCPTTDNAAKSGYGEHSYDESAWGYQTAEGHAHNCRNCGAHDTVLVHTPGAAATESTPQTCTVCGYVIAPATGTGPGSGTVILEVKPGANAPVTNISTPTEEMKDMLLTEAEKQQVQNGTDIRIVLEVQDAENTVSAPEQAVIQQELNDFAVGQYLNIELYKLVGAERRNITETTKKIRIAINVPDSLKNADSSKTRTFEVIRLHDGVAEFLTDLDDNADTITIETDRFSIYAVVYQDKPAGGNNGDGNSDNGSNDSGQKDSEPKTGDYTPLELYATLAMIAGFAYLFLYFTDRNRGMTEETKKEFVAGIVEWAKRGGRLRKCLALAAIFVLLVYYHSIGKKTCVEWKEIYGE